MSLIRTRFRAPERVDVGFDPFDDLIRRFESLVGWPALGLDAFGWRVPLDLTERDDEYEFTAELPGVDREDVELAVEGNVLTLRAKKERKQEREEGRARVSERSYGEVARSIVLPHAVDPDKIEADLKDGVLTVRLPKRPDARSRRIAIGSGNNNN